MPYSAASPTQRAIPVTEESSALLVLQEEGKRLSTQMTKLNALWDHVTYTVPNHEPSLG